MSFLDELKKARGEKSSAFLQFKLNYPNSQQDIHAFLEGKEDAAFYQNFLLRIQRDIDKIHLYVCNDKKTVYELHEKINGLIKVNSPVFFFVDKDYSDLLGESYKSDPKIYVTEFYSIENYLVSKEMLHRVWREILKLSAEQDLYPRFASKFQGALKKFHAAMLPLSAWMIFNRRIGLRPQYNNIKLSELYAMDSEMNLELKFEPDFDYFEKCYKIECPIDLPEKLPQLIGELVTMDPKKYVRGKYELWFFFCFIKKLVELLNVKIDTQLTETNAITILGPRIQMPKSLEDFFRVNGVLPE